MPRSSHQAFCQNICMIHNTDSIDIPVTLLFLPFTLAVTPWSFSEQTGHWHTNHWYHFHTVDNVAGNTYQLLKEHILGDTLCGSIEMKQQKHVNKCVVQTVRNYCLFQNCLPHCKLFAQLDKRHHMFYKAKLTLNNNILKCHSNNTVLYFLTSWTFLCKFMILIRFTSHSRQNKGTN